MISTGAYHSAFLDKRGQVWTIGSSTRGQTGQGSCDESTSLVQVKQLAEITDIACGYLHTACLDRSGNVWVFGDASYGQLGFKTKLEIAPWPTRVPNPLPSISFVHCGTHHTVCLDQARSAIWVFGSNEFGQLGLGDDDEKYFQPIRIVPPSNKSIDLVTCGGNFTMIMDSEGKVFATGCNELGELGLGSDAKKIMSFTEMKEAPSHIKIISAGWNHTVILNEAGELFSCGNGGNGRLGHGDCEHRTVPTLIKGIPKMNTVQCGTAQTRCIDFENSYWRCGYNGYGELATGDRKDLIVFEKLPDINILQMFATPSSFHGFLLDEDSQVWGYGFNHHSVLVRGTEEGDDLALHKCSEQVSRMFAISRLKSAKK